MKKIELVEVFLAEKKVGRLALTRDNIAAFEYDAGFLAKGFSVSPFELPLKPGVLLAKRHPFNGNFGVFDDCLPDGWGLLLLDRFLLKQKINPKTLTLLDRLSLVGSSGRGALEFRPDQSVLSQDEFLSFEHLAEETRKILANDSYQGDSIEELYRQGGSPGGARPKIFVHADDREWLVKFRAAYDPVNVGLIEFNYSLLAQKCGVEMPETRLFENKFFGVQRFDRSTKGKIHVVSVAGLLHADYRLPALDYLNIFQLCQALTRNMQEMWKLYRLMVFNFLIGNKDDHARNFAFIFENQEWKLAPAFDILKSDGINGYHTTSFNNSVLPVKDDLLAVAEKAGLDKKKAEIVYEEMREIIINFPQNL